MMSQTAQIINFGDYAHLAMSPTDREHWSSEYIGASLPMDWDAFQLVRGRDRDFLLFACDCACQTLHLWERKRRKGRHLPRRGLETLLLHIDGDCSLDEVKEAAASLNSAMGLLPTRPPQWLSDDAILCWQQDWGAAHCVWSVLIRVSIPWAAAWHFRLQYRQRFIKFCKGQQTNRAVTDAEREATNEPIHDEKRQTGVGYAPDPV